MPINLNEDTLCLIKDYLIEKTAPDVIILFGSAAKGKLRCDSDIDLAILSDQTYEDYDLFMIAQGLADRLDRDVDLVHLNKATTVFQAHVISTGKVLYCADELKRALFYMLTLKKYAQLNEERECVLNKLEKEGYGL